MEPDWAENSDAHLAARKALMRAIDLAVRLGGQKAARSGIAMAAKKGPPRAAMKDEPRADQSVEWTAVHWAWRSVAH
jgi:hypothetical protein